MDFKKYKDTVYQIIGAAIGPQRNELGTAGAGL